MADLQQSVGLYSPGSSVLHRARAGVKLAVAGLLMVALVTWLGPWELAAIAGVTLLGYLLSGVGWRVGLAQVWPMRWFVLVLLGVQVLIADLERAVLTVGSLVVAVALAGLVTVTTRVSDMLTAFVAVLGPTRHVGVDPERVALLLALGIRAVPVVARLGREVREAQVARGLRMGPRTYAVPLTVRALRHADALGEALLARGIDD